LSSVFVDMKSYYSFQLLTKLLYYGFCFSLTYGSLKLAFPNKSLKELLPKQLLIWVILLLSGYRQFMESEELAVIFVICHFLFIYSDNKKANSLSGLFIFLLFGCKAVTIVYSGFALLYWLFYTNNKEKTKRIIISHIVFTLFSILLYASIFSVEIRNIVTAMSYQNSARFDGFPTIKRFLLSLFRYLYYLPGLLIIPAGLLFALIKDRKQSVLIALSVLVASFCVIIQNRFSSPYHYLAFIPVIIYIAFFAFDHKKYIISILIIPVLAVICIQNFSYTVFYPKASNKMYREYFMSQAEGYTQINNYIKQSQNPTGKMLYLTGDCPPYFMTIPSINNMVGAILLNRGVLRVNLRSSPAYLKMIEDVKLYNGTYILYDPSYLPFNTFPLIKQKLETDYTPVLKITNVISDLGEETMMLYQKN
jgi:hypothetical protein